VETSKKKVIIAVVAVGLIFLYLGCVLLFLALTHPPQSIEGMRFYPSILPEAIEKQKIIQRTLLGFGLVFIVFGVLFCVLAVALKRSRMKKESNRW